MRGELCEMRPKLFVLAFFLLIIISAGCTQKLQSKDSDFDGWTDDFERGAGTDPLNKDTDSDGLWDSKDPNPLVAEAEKGMSTEPPKAKAEESIVKTPTPTQQEPPKLTIPYSDVSSQISVSDYRYAGITCPAGVCKEDSSYPAIGKISGYNHYSKSYLFKINYVPSSSKSMYFEAYAPDILNGFATSNAMRLSSGENPVYMSSSTSSFDEQLNVKLCFSYIDFYIANSGGIPKFYKRDAKLAELESSEYVCINKVFEAPYISVQISPSTVNFNVNAKDATTNQVLYAEQTITITNTGKVPQIFYLFVPQKGDGTTTSNDRPTKKPDFVEFSGYDTLLAPGQSHTYKISLNLVYSPSMQTYFTDTAYIYTPLTCDALYLASCYQSAPWKQAFTLTTSIMK